MPFDCTPVIEAPTRSRGLGDNLIGLGIQRSAATIRPRPIPAWHSSRRLECIGDTPYSPGLASCSPTNSAGAADHSPAAGETSRWR
jgi:hypothetical protein